MNLTLWISFVGTALILAITPGPSVLLAMANSMKYGAKKTNGTILGDLSANLIQMILASVGLAAIVVSSGQLFQVIKWLGVAYLIYMGIKRWLADPKIILDQKKASNGSFLKLYTEGFLMSATNPKAIVFFAALFPLFIDQSLPLAPQLIILAVTFLVLDGLSLLIYSHFAFHLKSYLQNQEKVHWQNKIIGTLLILSGLMLSTVKRANR